MTASDSKENWFSAPDETSAEAAQAPLDSQVFLESPDETPAPKLTAALPTAPAEPELFIDDSEFIRKQSSSRVSRMAAVIAGLGALGIFALGTSRPQQAEAVTQRPVPAEIAPVVKPAPVVKIPERVVAAVEVPIEVPQQPLVIVRHKRLLKRVELRMSLPAPTVSAEAATRSLAARRIRAGAQMFGYRQLERALVHYTKAVELEPDNVEALFGVALVSVELHRDDDAERALVKALRLAPGHPMANLLTGYLKQLYSDRAAAKQHYAKYLEAEPDGKFAIEVRAVMGNL